MTESKFRNADWLLANKPWDFFMMVEMGPDRLNHGIWSFIDPEPPALRGRQPVQGVAARVLPIPRRQDRRASRPVTPTTTPRFSS